MRGKADLRPAAAALVAVVVTLAGLAVLPAAPPARAQAITPVVHRKTLAPGLTLTSIYFPTGPQHIKVLTVDPSIATDIDVALSDNKLSGFETVPSMASRYDAIAGINGDFGVKPGRPMHAYAEDGDLMQTPLQTGPNFSVSTTGQVSFGTPSSPPGMHCTRYPNYPPAWCVNITATVPPYGSKFAVARWNTGYPKAGEIAGYSGVGAGVSNPPTDSCSVRLSPASSPAWTTTGKGVVTTYTVAASACSGTTAMALDGGIVLSAKQRGPAAATLQSLLPGDSLRMYWSFGWTDTLWAIGGMPALVTNGVLNPNLGTCWSAAFCGPNPRTAVGVTADGRVLLATVDGRRPAWSVGMTLQQWGKEMLRLGAVYAINLDGGGSTTMVADGKVINKPSDPSGPRAVCSAILVLPASDPGDPVIPSGLLAPAPATATETDTPAPASADTWKLISSDPGSTGGLLDYLKRASG